MPWIWSCHKCHTRYALATTRRCLHDGHYFCGGTTIDKATGKTKRHRACASEFDYIGWETFNAWKREQNHPHQNPHLKHCESQCDFPSACHWKTRHTPRKDAHFSSFLDPECLESEEPAAPPKTATKSSAPELTLPKLFTRIVKAAEKRTSQITTLLSTLEEESNFASTPGYIPPSSNPPTQQRDHPPPKLNPLSLHLPTLDFSHEPSLSSSISLSTSTSTSTFSSDSLSTTETSPDINMKDWIPTPSSSSPTSPTFPQPPSPPPKSPLRLFDFTLATNISTTSTAEDNDYESPISPQRSVWEWTSGDIGIALSIPASVDRWSGRMVGDGEEEGEEEEEGVEEGMEEGEEEEGEEEGMDMLWERDVVFRRVSV